MKLFSLPMIINGMRLPQWLRIKEFTCQCRRPGINPWVRKIPWRRKWQPIPVLLLGKSHGQKNLVGYSPWGCTESYMMYSIYLHIHKYLAIGWALKGPPRAERDRIPAQGPGGRHSGFPQGSGTVPPPLEALAWSLSEWDNGPF